MSNYLTLSVDLSAIYPVPVQNARVKGSLTVNQLIQEILNEFGDETNNRPENYRIFRKDDSRPLGGRESLMLQGVRDRQVLIFTSISEAQRQNLGQSTSVYLLMTSSGDKFPIKWHPAIIGRPDFNNRSQNDSLAVNLEGYENSSKVSRQHAQIKFRKGRYILQALSDRNPTILNGRRLEVDKSYPLEDRDEIRLGFSQIELKFFVE